MYVNTVSYNAFDTACAELPNACGFVAAVTYLRMSSSLMKIPTLLKSGSPMLVVFHAAVIGVSQSSTDETSDSIPRCMYLISIERFCPA